MRNAAGDVYFILSDINIRALATHIGVSCKFCGSSTNYKMEPWTTRNGGMTTDLGYVNHLLVIVVACCGYSRELTTVRDYFFDVDGRPWMSLGRFDPSRYTWPFQVEK